MVKKLLKHEFLAYLRVWIPMQIILMAAALFGRILQFFESDSDIYSIISVSSVVIYVIAVIASLGLTLVFGVVRFYKNLFSCEGYLSFTLPVTTTQHLFTKMFTAGVFTLCTYVSVFLSVFIITSGELFSKIIEKLSQLLDLGYTYAGTNMTFYIIEFIALILISAFAQFLLYYACIAIGQIFRKNRVIGAVVVYFIHYVITQILSTLVLVVITLAGKFLSLDGFEQFIVDHPFGMIHIYLCGMIVLELVTSAIYYFVTHVMIRKKLNLE